MGRHWCMGKDANNKNILPVMQDTALRVENMDRARKNYYVYKMVSESDCVQKGPLGKPREVICDCQRYENGKCKKKTLVKFCALTDDEEDALKKFTYPECCPEDSTSEGYTPRTVNCPDMPKPTVG